MMKFERAIKSLQEGEDYEMKVFGNSMKPIIESGSIVTFRATDDYQTDDVVMTKVKSRWLVHKVTKIGADGRYMIANNHGRENGWTKRIYGRVIKIGDDLFGRKIENKEKKKRKKK